MIRPAGADALLVEVADAGVARRLAAHLRAAGLDVDDLVPAARSLLVDGVASPAAVAEAVSAFRDPGPSVEGELVVLPIRYDGPDLAAVAQLLGCSPQEVATRHQAIEFRCEFTGFAPGFGYLSGWRHPVPRLPSPRSRVPAGSVALADTWCGVYPSDSPGGWLIIGSTETRLWALDRDPPALLVPGTRVRFREVAR